MVAGVDLPVSSPSMNIFAPAGLEFIETLAFAGGAGLAAAGCAFTGCRLFRGWGRLVFRRRRARQV